MGLRERLGSWIGKAWSPAVAALSGWRHARMFHPTGHVFAGYATPVPGPFAALGEELCGRVLARASGALWRDEWEHLDVLGLAFRFRAGLGPDLDENPEDGDQDLLAATIRSPLTMLGSPLATNTHDFLANTFWAVSPFEHAVGRIELRLVPVAPPNPTHGTRLERLQEAVRAGEARWILEARRTLHLHWSPVARIHLDHAVELDQDALAFDPFRGRLRPVGVVQWIRKAAYAASQRARPHGGLPSHS